MLYSLLPIGVSVNSRPSATPSGRIRTDVFVSLRDLLKRTARIKTRIHFEHYDSLIGKGKQPPAKGVGNYDRKQRRTNRTGLKLLTAEDPKKRKASTEQSGKTYK